MKLPALIITIFISLISLPTMGKTPISSGQIMREAREAYNEGDYLRSLSLADSVYKHTSSNLTKIESNALKAKSLANLGKLYEAEEAYKATWQMSDRILGSNNASTINALFNYALFLDKTGRFKESLEITERMTGKPDANLFIDLSALRASSFAHVGNLEMALSSLDTAINIAIQHEGNIESLPILVQNRGYYKDLNGNFIGAIKDYDAALKSLKGKAKGSTLANKALSQAKVSDFTNAISNINEAIRLLSEYGSADEDYIIALRKRGEILHLKGDKKGATKNMEDFFNKERARLTNLLPGLDSQMRLSYWTKEKPLLSKVFITGEYAPNLAMDVALMRRQTSLMGSGKIEKRISQLNETAEDISKRLNEDEMAVAFVLYNDSDGEPQNAAITLDHQGRENFIKLFPQDSLYRYREEIQEPIYDAIINKMPGSKNLLYTDTVLGTSLWEPILRVAGERINTIHFAPEGIFHLWGIENMPFEGKENYNIVRHFALNDINSKKKVDINSEVEGNSLIAGGFDYNDADEYDEDYDFSGNIFTSGNKEAYRHILRANDYDPGESIFTFLPGTEKEVRRISETIPHAKLRFRLTENNFKDSASSYNLIHLATHGYSLSSDLSLGKPVETDSIGYDMTLWISGLALTGANVAGMKSMREDGILSAREICDLDLSNADLVVLSACETAQGLITDESASGLLRALKNAGANTVVVSLWEVDDESTCYFMTRFHDGLHRGLSKYDAFNEAQSETKNYYLIREKRKFHPGVMASRPTGETERYYPFSAPLYWAPFIIIDP